MVGRRDHGPEPEDDGHDIGDADFDSGGGDLDPSENTNPFNPFDSDAPEKRSGREPLERDTQVIREDIRSDLMEFKKWRSQHGFGDDFSFYGRSSMKMKDPSTDSHAEAFRSNSKMVRQGTATNEFNFLGEIKNSNMTSTFNLGLYKEIEVVGSYSGRLAGIVTGTLMVAAGAALCATAVGCIAGSTMISFGVNDYIEGVTGGAGPVRGAFQSFAVKHTGRAELGDAAYNISGVALSFISNPAFLLRPGAWKLFHYIPSDYIVSQRLIGALTETTRVQALFGAGEHILDVWYDE
ncbi:MAG: DUF4225 domain-containing protein [Burkholderiales bacterium]